MSALETIKGADRSTKRREWPAGGDAFWDDSGSTDTDNIMLAGTSERGTNFGDVQMLLGNLGGTAAAGGRGTRFPSAGELLTQQDIDEYSTEEGIDDPFEELKGKTPKKRSITNIIAHFRMSTDLPYGQRLADRLEFLIRTEKARYPVDWQFSGSSLIGFLSFMEKHPRLRYPDLSLSPDGFIVAQWRESTTRNAVLQFQDTGWAQLVLFAPSPAGATRISGVMSPQKAFQTLEVHGADRWCTR